MGARLLGVKLGRASSAEGDRRTLNLARLDYFFYGDLHGDQVSRLVHLLYRPAVPRNLYQQIAH